MLLKRVAFLIGIVGIISSTLLARSAVEQAGDLLEYVLPLSALGVTAIKQDWKGSLQAAVTFGVTKFTVHDLKYLIDAPRPKGGHHSFPSGHTAISFASAGFLQRRYGWRYGLPYLCAAAFVGYSRIEAKAHWIEDVIVGALIGWIYSRIFPTPYQPKLTIDPHATHDSFSLAARYLF